MNSDNKSRPVIFYFDGAFINRENGSHVRASDFLSFLANISMQIIVYSYQDHPTCPWSAVDVKKFADEYPNVELVLERRSFLLRLRYKILLYISMFWPSPLALLIGYAWPRLSPRLSDLRRRVMDPIYIINYARGLFEINGAPRRATIVETHDLYFLNSMKQQGGKPTDLKVLIKARGELAALHYAYIIISISPPETHFFRLFLEKSDIYYVPYFGHINNYQDRASSEREYRLIYDILFVGSDNKQNIRGLIHFIKSHTDWLKGRSFAIAGKVSLSSEVRSCATDVGAHLLGFVEDVEGLYRASKIVVSPVDGTGLKIKVLEALSAGKPVFGSTHTLEGLPPGFEGCVSPIAPDKMDALIFDDNARKDAERLSRQYFKALTERGDLFRLRKTLLDLHLHGRKSGH